MSSAAIDLCSRFRDNHSMNKIKSVLGILSVLLIVLSAASSVAEARIGGGRSSGFRGSRGFAPRQARPYTNPGTSQQQQPSNQGAFGQQSPMGSPMMRGVLGGLAGGFIGSMLFRNMGYGAGTGADTGSGGIGMLEILVLAGLGFMVFRMFAQRRMAAANHANPINGAYDKLESVRGTGPFANDEQNYAQTLQLYDATFDLNRFKEQRMDDFLKIQSAWNSRDLRAVESLIVPEFQKTLDADVQNLKTSGQINKLENIAVRGAELAESWQEYGKEYATLKLKAQLLDYTIDERTQTVVAGDRNQPVKFEEEWTFVRGVGDQSQPWKLTAISNG